MDKRLVFFYIVILSLLLVQSFSHVYVDEGEFMASGHFMSIGKVPHKDFVQFHNMFYYVFYLPIFIIFKGPLAHIMIRLISVAMTAMCAYLVYRIAQKNHLGRPHVAALIFLLGYTGLPISFLRNEYFAMVSILAYLYFDRPFLKGIMLAFFGASSIMFIIPAMMLFAYYLFMNFKKKDRLLPFLFGTSIVGSAFLLFLLVVSFKAFYYNLYELTMMLGKQITKPWFEIVFFSLILSAPYMLIGGWNLIRNMKKGISKEAFVLLIGIFGSIGLVSLLSGGLVKGKLPSYLPALAILAPFCSKVRYEKIVILMICLMTLAVYTPSFRAFDYIDNQYALDSCVRNDASVQKVNDNGFMMFRPSTSYYWYNIKNFKAALIDTKLKEFESPIKACGFMIESTDILCEDGRLQGIDSYCKSPPKMSLVYVIRKAISEAVGIRIGFSE